MRNALRVVVLAAATFGFAASALAETVDIYAAGSLTKVVQALGAQAGPVAGVELKSTFGSAGKLRARIEAGERPDLFLSADLAAPQKLAADGRTVLPPIVFAQNRMCLIARHALGVTNANLVQVLLKPSARLKTSTPGEDPGGDYAMAIFNRIDARSPGSGDVLRRKAQATAEGNKAATPLEGRSPSASLFLTGRIDLLITYCNGAPDLQREDADLDVVLFPFDLDPHLINAMAVLSSKPAALRLALFLMSEKGQAIVLAAGLVPLSEP